MSINKLAPEILTKVFSYSLTIWSDCDFSLTTEASEHYLYLKNYSLVDRYFNTIIASEMTKTISNWTRKKVVQRLYDATDKGRVREIDALYSSKVVYELSASILPIDGSHSSYCAEGHALCIAVENGSDFTLSSLLGNGVNAGLCGVKGSSALFLSAEQGNLSTTKLLLANGADIDAAVSLRLRYTALFGAVMCPDTVSSPLKSYKMTAFLLENGANVSAQTRNKSTALHLAAQYGKTEIIRLLIANGGDVNAKQHSKTPLMIASEEIMPAATKILLESGADCQLKAIDGYDALGRAILSLQIPCLREEERDIGSVIKHLAQYGANLNQGPTPPLCLVLRHATYLKRAAIEALVSSGADIENTDVEGDRPLDIFFKKPWHENSLNLLDVLLSCGANPNKSLPNGMTPLAYLCLLYPHSEYCLIERRYAIKMLVQYGRRFPPWGKPYSIDGA